MTSTPGSEPGGAFESVLETYRAQGVGLGRVGFGRTCACIVVDFQNVYTRGARGCGTNAVERTGRLLGAVRLAGVPIFYTLVAFNPGNGPGVWGDKCPALHTLDRNGEECRIDDLVKPAAGDTVYAKQAPSAFFGTPLAGKLRALGVDTVITCGTSTSGCIRATVVDGVSHGFRMLVPRQCVSDRSEPSAVAALFDIDAKYGDVVDVAEVEEHLSRLTGTGD